MRILYGFLLAAFLLAPAAAQTPTATQITLPAALKATVLADLQAAADDAAANNDTRHGPCWKALATFVDSGIANPLPTKPGVFLLAQKVFDFQAHQGQPLIDTATAQACGPTILDLRITFLQLLAKVGLTVSPIKLPNF